MNKTPQCQQPSIGYIEKYPEAVKFAETQFSILWPPEEYPVQEDIHQVLTEFSEAEKHAVITVLKLFTHYELKAGNEYWGNRIMKKYPSVCIQRMASAFSHAELNMHAPFYNNLNKALNLDTEEFYSEYINSSILKERMDFIDQYVNSDNDLLSLAVFSIVEGAVLYSSFAFLKHFRSRGKNMLKNLVSGINSSVRDESLHADGGAWLYRQHLKESNLKEEERKELETQIISCARKIKEHEEIIVNMLFEKGPIPGITNIQLSNFVKSRINICLKNLNIETLGQNNLYKIKYNPIADWFYDSINTIKFHDFFDTSGNEYHRKWNQNNFTW